MSAHNAAADALQRKIFSRYVNQKLSTSRGINVVDVVDEGKTGVLLFNLIEVLSENQFGEKYNANPKMRVHSLDNCNRALKFAKEQGVIMKVFPQAENLVDGDEKACLGLIWSIILKFMKFGDADESLNAKDALLMWVQNKTHGYAGVEVKDFKSSMKDGLALGAVIHKHRPSMINFNDLKPGAANAATNWKIVQAAAEAYFNLEPYITPEEITRLDENCMVIYVADFYYGIAEQRKVDLAGRRLHKLIDFTKVNDELRAQYADRAHSFTSRVAKVRELLNDRTIDNNMEGAKHRIAQFYEYKATDKSAILADQLNIEGLYNSLSMRLANGKRPAYVPPAGTDLDAMNATVAELEKTEQERKTALHAELNRQIKLLDFDRQHKDRSVKLAAYQAETLAYLQTKEVSHSVGAAEYQVRRLDASDEQRQNIFNSTFTRLKEAGSYLESEHYERTHEVRAREAELEQTFAQLAESSAAKRPILLDDLSREKFREEMRLQNEQHISDFNSTLAWVAESEAYLSKKEHVDSVADANRQLGLIQAYAASKESKTKNNVASIKALGAKINSARYNEGLSTYQFGDAPDTVFPIDIHNRESTIDEEWHHLDKLYAQKKAILDDDFARETFRHALVLRNQQHIKQFNQISAWVKESESYLRHKEVTASVSDAQVALSIIQAYVEDKATQTESSVAHLKKNGGEILTAKYEGLHSSYTFGSAATDTAHPQDIQSRESTVDQSWAELDSLYDHKKAVLDDDLAREQFRTSLRLQNQTHIKQHAQLVAWATENEAYLNHKEVIDSVPEAQTALSILDAYLKDNAIQIQTNVAFLNQKGVDILTAKYETQYSSYTFGSAASDTAHPVDIQTREADIQSRFQRLDERYRHKLAVLSDDLAREQFRALLTQQNQTHIKQHSQLVAWSIENEAYLSKKEVIDSVPEAQTALSILEAFSKDKVTQTETSVDFLNHKGAGILSAEYETQYSSYTFGSAASDTAHPVDIQTREADIQSRLTTLDGLHAQKHVVLSDDLARESFREALYVQDSTHHYAFNALEAWSAESTAYLQVREEIDDIPKANTAISILAGWREGKAQQINTAAASFKQAGHQILSAKYETQHSSYTFGSAASDRVHPADIQKRESDIDAHWGALDELAATKDQWLAGERDRELRKEEKRVEFANQSSAFIRTTVEAGQEAEATHFGFTLAEVEAFAAKLSESDASIRAATKKELDVAVATFGAGAALGVNENVYTNASPASLGQQLQVLEGELEKRQGRYNEELERQRYLDDLCRQFAAIADPFAANIVASKNGISNSREELEVQLQSLLGRIEQANGSDRGGLEAIDAAQQKLDAEGVTNNIHTTQTAKDITVQHQQFNVFLERKQAMLTDAIEQAKLRGLTPDQFKEIDENFNQFDADHDKLLSARELKTCLYSLGEEKGPKQIAEIVEKYGNGSGSITYENFKEFMIQLFGDADTKDEILNGFQLINRRADGIATPERIALVMVPEDVDCIVNTSPAKGEGSDYVAWTEDAFSR